ncbi:MAG: ATP-binding protein [Anaerolineae bacterium]
MTAFFPQKNQQKEVPDESGTFEFKAAEVSLPSNKSKQPPLLEENIKVLYMDDDPSLHYLARFILERSNCVVDIAPNGLQGLEMYESGRYDVVTVNRELAELSGLEVINLITNAHDHPPVIMITAEGDEQMAVAAMRSGVSDYIVKDGEGRFLQLLPKVILQVVQQYRMKKDWADTQLELALEKERGRLLADFITKASHEFRTPLTIISTVASLIEKVVEDERAHKWVGRIQDQCKGIDHLIADMLVLTQLDQGLSKEAPVDLERLLRSVAQRWSLLCDDSKITFQYINKGLLPSIMGSLDELDRALDELIQNAFQHTPQGQGVVVIASVDESRSQVLIKIVDTGIGISPIHIPHVFDTFYRVDESHSTRGFGLGLPIAQKIIGLHGGTCELSSLENEGTTLTVRLPAYQNKQSF